MKLLVVACMHALIILALPCHAEPTRTFEFSVSAMTLPGESSGLIHWRTGETATQPLQLSTRYFSEHMKAEGSVIAFYKDPVAAGPPQTPPPVPLVILNVPADAKLVYILLWSETDENSQTNWKSRLFDDAEWKAGSMKLINASSEQFGISAGNEGTRLPAGKSMDFKASDWPDAFPVKISRMEPELKTIFSSTWRVAKERRELCIMASVNGAISLRCLIDLATPPPPPEEIP